MFEHGWVIILMNVSRDPRNPVTPLRSHASTHSDDITAVHFANNTISSGDHNHNVLLSASTDGLLCTSNAREDDEDEAGRHVGNWGCSVAQCAWIHGRGSAPAIWAASDMETFSVWTREVSIFTMNRCSRCHL